MSLLSDWRNEKNPRLTTFPTTLNKQFKYIKREAGEQVVAGGRAAVWAI